MTVLVIYSTKDATGDDSGGIFNAALAQVQGLTAIGIPVTVWSASLGFAKAAESFGATTLFDLKFHNGVKPLFKPICYWRGWISRTNRPAAVIHHGGRTWFWGKVFYPFIPHAQVLHRHRVGAYKYFRNWLAISTLYAEEMRAQFPNKRIETARNGLRPDFQMTDAPTPLREDDGTLRIVSVGRPAPTKGFDVLIRAFARLRARGVEATLTIAGVEQFYYDEVLAETELTGEVDFPGRIADVDGFLDASDVFVLPSRVEPFGLVVLEAMARGRTVVATQSHGPKDIVIDGETGYLVPIDDPTSIADRLENLASTRRILSKMGAAAHKRVRDAYNPRVIGAELAAALRSFGAVMPEPDVLTDITDTSDKPDRS